MVEGASVQLECKLVKTLKLGDHTTFVGEVIEAYLLSGKAPIVYYNQKYWKIGDNIPKPAPEEIERINSVIEKHKK